jgi:hypothetical protein
MHERFSLTVLGQPKTKKRARTGTGISKNGKRFRWSYTDDSWYEEMIQRAFIDKYPDAEPIGSECAIFDDLKNEWKLDTKHYSDMDLPKLEMDCIFYCHGGKVGDEDNYLKIVKDALNGFAYVDDRQVKTSMPFVVSLDDPDYKGWLEHDEDCFNNCRVQERLDVLIRPFNPQCDKLLALRRFFERNNKSAYDYLARYYDNEYRNMTKKQLVEIAEEYSLDVEKMTKDQIVEFFIQDDLKNSDLNDGRIKRHK